MMTKKRNNIILLHIDLEPCEGCGELFKTVELKMDSEDGNFWCEKCIKESQICDSDEKWDLSQICDESQICDSKKGKIIPFKSKKT